MAEATRLVWVEDYIMLCKIVLKNLKMHGEVIADTAVVCQSVPEAFDDLNNRIADGLLPHTMFVVDIDLAGQPSLPFLEELRRVGVPRHRVILSSGREPDSEYEPFIGSCITKPYGWRDFLHVLQQAAAE